MQRFLRAFLLVIVLGIIYWLATKFLPLQSPFPELLMVVLILAIIYEIAVAFGLAPDYVPRK